MKTVYIIPIIVVAIFSITLVSISAEESLIPFWLKNTVSFWVNDQVSDQEFISAMEWMIENDVIKVSSSDDEWKTEADKLYRENEKLTIENIQLKAKIDYLEEQIDKSKTMRDGDDKMEIGVNIPEKASTYSDYLDNGCHRDFPYLWSDEYCYNVPEPSCTAEYPYPWSDGFCYKSPEYLSNGCHSNFPYLWSDGRCYTVPEYTYDKQVDSAPSCDPSYPDVCIPPYPPDLDCDEIYYSNFRVTGHDPHGFDTDYDGIGCEVGSPSSSSSPPPTQPSCDPSYPDVCIPPYPPDLDCGEIGYSNFRVIGSDPHGFDRDKDGIGCES